MTVYIDVTFSCGGCFLESKATSRLTGRKCPISSREIWDVCPEGWVAFDPYTGCCYCQKCWEDIIGGIDNE